MSRARKHLHDLLPRDGNGKLLSLSCPDRCFEVFGVGVYTYMLWMRHMKLVFFVCFLFSLANLVQNAFGGVLRQSQSPLSVHTLGNIEKLDASYGASELLILCVLLWGMFEGASLVRRTAASMRTGPAFLASDSSILLQLPGVGARQQAPTREAVKEAMEPYGKVRHVTVVYDVRDLVARMKERQSLLKELFSVRCDLFLRGRAPQEADFKGGKSSKKFWKQSEQRAALRERMKGRSTRLDMHDEESIHLMRAPGRKCTGMVFVMFEEAADAERALRSIAAVTDPAAVLKKRVDKLTREVADNGRDAALDVRETPAELLAGLGEGRRVLAQRAPEPTDLLWENLAASRAEQWRRQLRTLIIVLLLSLVGTVIIAAVIFLNREGGLFQDAINPTIESHSGLSAVVIALLLQLIMVIPVTLGNGLIFWTVPLIGEKWERHHTHAALELSIALKCTFFQVLNTVAAAGVFYLDPFVRSTCGMRQWYSLGGALIVNILFGDFLFIQVLMDCIKVDVIAARTCIARTAKSQHEMNQIYAAPAGIYLAFRMQQAGKYLVLAPMFGSSIPVLFLVASLYFWLGSFIDRYNLLRRLAPPPATDERLTKAAALYIFPTGVVLHVLMALVFFYQLPAISKCGDELDALAMASANGAGNNASALLNAPPSPSLPPTAPPPAPTLSDDEWLAYRMLLAISSVGGVVLAYFALRELARCRGRRFDRLSKAQKMVRIIVGEAATPGGAASSGESGTTLSVEKADFDFIRYNPYVPPFPPRMLRAYADLKATPKPSASSTVVAALGPAAAAAAPADEENQLVVLAAAAAGGGASSGGAPLRITDVAVEVEPPPLPTIGLPSEEASSSADISERIVDLGEIDADAEKPTAAGTSTTSTSGAATTAASGGSSSTALAVIDPSQTTYDL